MIRRVFVYGTLRPQGSAHHRFLAGYTVSHTPAALSDHALYGRTFRYPFAVPEPGLQVLGDVLTIPEVGIHELLEILDEYEGDEYLRTTVGVVPEHGDPVEAWIYLAIPDIELPPDERITSGDWFTR